MGVITPGNFQGDDRFHFLREETREMHYLRKPINYGSAMAWSNLGYQMQYSVETLEQQLVDEGNPHVLQINFSSYSGNWKEPDSWRLYADGGEVAGGSGKYARQCFESSAERFRDVCREAVLAAGLDALDMHDYRLLQLARAVAAVEPYDKGSCELGDKDGRVY